MLVKIFSHKDQSMFGSGFIVGNHLFTAAHLFYNGNDIESHELFYFVVDDKQYEFKMTKSIFIEHIPIDSYSGKESIFRDLAIFDISEFNHLTNNLEFLSNDPIHKQPLITKGFSNYGNSYDEFHSIVSFPNHSYVGVGKIGGVGKFTNCFKINEIAKIGNSGGPVYFQNKINGLLLSCDDSNSPNRGTTVLKSEYIQEILSGIY